MGDGGSSLKGSGLTLAAMVFAVSMTFIDMTIVAIASPDIRDELGLSQDGLQWVINGYLLSLAALFAFGGRLSDIVGHRRVVVTGVLIFAGASTLVGLTPDGSYAEAWIITFRVIQGAGAALLFPAALAIVMVAFPLDKRGQATALFFGIAGGLTAVGPIAGGYLAEWTWRAIFWVNIPVAVIALVLTALAKPPNTRTPGRMDWIGLALVTSGMALSVLGLQQASSWGWTSAATLGCLAAGLVLLVAFVLVELRVSDPLIRVRIFLDRSFAAENGVLFFAMAVFVPVFFFGSLYAQASLGQSASDAGLYLLIFFAGFAPAVQVGGRLLDTIGAKLPVTLGCAIATVGYVLWAGSLTDLSESAQWPYIVIAGAGTGMMIGPANTDAVNRAGPQRFGEGTGITQTVRNFGSALGMAVLGTLLITSTSARVEASLEGAGVPAQQAALVAEQLSSASAAGSSSEGPASGSASGPEAQVAAEVPADIAEAMQVVFRVMAGLMGAAFLVGLVALPRGRQESEAGPAPDVGEPEPEPA